MDEKQLLELIKSRFPQTEEFASVSEVEQFRQSNPSLYNTIQRYIALVSEPSQTQQTQQGSSPDQSPAPQLPAGLLGLAMLPFIKNRVELMEEDSMYVSLKGGKLKEWQKNNPDKKGTQAELDYVYGSLDNPDSSSLQKDSEAAFREQYKNNPKVVARIAKYDENKKKIYKNKKGVFKLGDDPAIKNYARTIQEEAHQRYNLLKKTDKDVQFHDVFRTVNEARWQQFASEYKEKAEAYSSANPEEIHKSAGEKTYFEWIKNGRERYLQTITPPPSPQVSPTEAITQRLGYDMRPEIERRMKAQLEQTQWTKPPPTPSPPAREEQHVTPRVQTQKLNLRRRALNWATGGRSERARQAFSAWANRGAGKITTRAIGGINRFANRLNIARHPIEAANSYAQNKAMGYAGQQLGRLGLRSLLGAARVLGGIAQGATATVGFFASPAGWIALIIVAVILLVFIIVFSFGGNLSGTPTTNPNPIPDLTIQKTGPTSIQNKENITYSITVSYSGSQDIVVDDPIPSNTSFVNATGTHVNTGNTISWRLKDNQAKIDPLNPSAGSNKYSFALTLQPTADDIEVKNKAVARTAGSLPVPVGGGSGNTCTQQYEGTGYCSTQYLNQFFGNKAVIASMICQAESGSNPFALNTNCNTNDYSAGLFQINLVAHCAGAYAGQSCRNPLDLNKRSVCEQKFKNPEENIKYAAQLSNNGASWTSWGTWGYGSKGNPSIREVVAKCKI